MKNLRELHYCLGVEFERNRKTNIITMNQRNYIEEVLKRFNLEEYNLVISILLKLSVEEFVNVQRKMVGVPYKAGLGSLMYVMVALRVDIAFAVSMVIQFMSKANPPHWMAVKRIMRYLKGTLDFKLYLGGKDIVLRGFYDANWMGDANNQ